MSPDSYQPTSVGASEAPRPKFYLGNDIIEIEQPYTHSSRRFYPSLFARDSAIEADRSLNLPHANCRRVSWHVLKEESMEDDDVVDADSDLGHYHPIVVVKSYSATAILESSSAALYGPTEAPPVTSPQKKQRAVSAHIEDVSDIVPPVSQADAEKDDKESSFCWRNEVRKCMSRRKLRENLDRLISEQFGTNKS
ncbi:hypothetical protein POJ06DRAFT_246722 [Lipomyces tetrasporus]|uniref:Uncharacterized protein n=1 Tax=Lipomyces tetrasporus TaxID=54092 RepID=A0AAD7QX89_9ASCO|nr:uncharacterized protein POJ06DRAFT_246722 [Lipomyces tetrasporus]KAJ8103144.1 hypothetical protein POJ06DRAFT_246722 [Lipomyces tetrasporus]